MWDTFHTSVKRSEQKALVPIVQSLCKMIISLVFVMTCGNLLRRLKMTKWLVSCDSPDRAALSHVRK